MSDPFLGQIILFGGNFAPVGWAACDGSLLSIAQNQALFSLLGTTYGGDGVSTFALPDLRGRAPIGWGQGPGLSPYTLGEAVGVETITLTVPQLPPHNHAMLGASGPAGGTQRAVSTQQTNAKVADPDEIQNTGMGMPVPVLQPVLACNYIIATQGIYPSRP